MKNLLLVAFTLLAISAFGQKKIVWFDWGLKVQGGASGFFNSDISDNKDINYELDLTNSYGLGAKLGINYDWGGLALEGMYFQGNQRFESLGNEIAPEFNWSSIDVYTLFKRNRNLGYIEIGPKVSFLSKMEADGVDVTSSYNSPNFAGVLGFGANLIGSDGAFTGMLGLRFEYQFTDFVSSDGKAINAPLSNISNFENNATTNPFFAGLVFELNWGIGYFGVAQCGQRSKFIMF
jgi:hypothetical protein